MGYPGRQTIYTATIRRMVLSALRQQEEAFFAQHAQDSDEMLLSYLRETASRLNHSPWEGEVIGGSLLRERFGSWEAALARAGLAPPDTENLPIRFQIVREEIARQKQIYRERKASKKRIAESRRARDASGQKKT